MFIDPNLQGQPAGEEVNNAAENNAADAGTQEGAAEGTTDAGQAGEGE